MIREGDVKYVYDSITGEHNSSFMEPIESKAYKRLANMKELEYRLQIAEERIRMLENRAENKNHDHKVNKSATIKVFDTNRTNGNMDSGNGYDAKIGIFTCPVTGTYFFTNVITQYGVGPVQTEIVLDGIGKGTTHASKQETGYDQGCTAAALHFDAGQRVWVKGYVGSEVFGSVFSSFTGILLWNSDDATNSN
ncbi:hypothetical protein CHS0354_042315 [Potamilus streckersoni]|uniref:C1q domain-containing protein n=1 Tax=Potamilus streckersoni TaxID=2493646 RepID=A0AAE0STP7_9BIVA|nr:hypothetical protein CHS0354_042315 [Potamilus streckersoni]